jgi:hypothetical protein
MVPFLLSRIRYQINGADVENINNPSQASTIRALLSYRDDFSKAEGLNMCWYKDTTSEAESVNTG